MELIDFEGIFQEKLLGLYRKNQGKYDPKKLHKLVRKAYAALADTYLPAAEATPRNYFSARSDGELASLLEAYIASEYEVPELLIGELSKRDAGCTLALLTKDASDELIRNVVRAVGGEETAYPRYYEVLERTENDEIAELLFDRLLEHPDAAKAGALALYKRGVKRELMLDLLSRVNERDEEVFAILLREFLESGEIALCAKYLARYGDPRALPVIREWLEQGDVDYPEFQELRCALEALGEHCDVERDFSDDPAYLAVHAEAPSAKE